MKRNLFETLDEIGGEAILGSNAATIPIREIAAGMKARKRIIGAHWVSPPYLVRVVEVIPSRWTAPDVIQQTGKILRRAGKVCVVCRDIPGKIILRIQFAMLNEAIHLLEIGAASAEDIDTAVRLSTGLKMSVFGPLKGTDFTSTHANVLNGMRFLYNATGDEKYRPSRLLKNNVKSGRLGIWAGKGWYDYAEDYKTLARQRDKSSSRRWRCSDKSGTSGNSGTGKSHPPRREIRRRRPEGPWPAAWAGLGWSNSVSTTGGETMQACLSPNGQMRFAAEAPPTRLAVATASGIALLERDEPGREWHVAGRALEGHHVSAMTALPGRPGFLAGTHGDGIYFSADGGTLWAERDDGVTRRDIYTLAAVNREGKGRNLCRYAAGFALPQRR